MVFAVQTPEAAERALIGRGALLVCISGALADRALVPDLAAAGIDTAAMELLPRITRAQSMDILSSQANLAGYRAVIEGAAAFDRGFAMMMTAAGTVPPARVFVLGAGVAGLPAIATARRLGALVSATDVRPAAKEELVTQAMVDGMRPGSVIVDIAADGGGNCAATRPGQSIVTPNGVKILGYRNWPGRIPVAASALYAKNLLTFLTTFWDKAAQAPKLPEDDAIVQGVLLTRGGHVVHAQFAGATPAPVAAPAPVPAGAAEEDAAPSLADPAADLAPSAAASGPAGPDAAAPWAKFVPPAANTAGTPRAAEQEAPRPCTRPRWAPRRTTSPRAPPDSPTSSTATRRPPPR